MIIPSKLGAEVEGKSEEDVLGSPFAEESKRKADISDSSTTSVSEMADEGSSKAVADMFNEPSVWQKQFAAEDVDPVWSLERQIQIDSTLRKLTQERSDVLINRVECKSRLCSVSLTMTSGDQGFMASAIAELSAAEWNRDGSVDLDQMKQTAQGLEVVLYVSRKQADSPQA